ncbi:MAG: DUF4351 domain-containing protein, partial [Candidatus Accumulibacter sp.]|nr:DUF4351 domain-containing protein [Accumulibacter sp.]
MLAERIESWFDEATQKRVKQGMQQGMQRGRVEGRLEGQANTLFKQLKLRFGELPPEVVEWLSHATRDELDAWVDAVLSAPTLSAVFEA